VHQDGTRWLRQVTPLCADTLRRMLEWIESDDPRVKKRLFPDTFVDPEEEAAWRRLMQTDLEHLVLSRRQILEKDLARMRPDGPGLFRLPIGKNHGQAWLSALNAARLALFELHGLGPEHMDSEPEELDDEERQLALVRIHLMGFLQELLLHGGEGKADA
jgi:hypothetical protein